MVNAGAIWLDAQVVSDRNLVTSRGPQDLVAFVPAMLAAFGATSPARRAAPALQSDPQRSAPPRMAMDAMRWSPKPSTAAAMACIGLAAAAGGYRRSRH
jgi:protease I